MKGIRTRDAVVCPWCWERFASVAEWRQDFEANHPLITMLPKYWAYLNAPKPEARR